MNYNYSKLGGKHNEEKTDNPCWAVLMLSLYGCSASSVSQVDDSYSGGNDSVSNIEDSGGSVYDYDKGYGYTAPEPGQSFSDYVKEQDPELYESLFE